MVCGIENLGNNCYINTVMQCMLHDKNIRDFFSKEIEGAGTLFNAIKKLKNIIYDMDSICKPTKFLQILKEKFESTGLAIDMQNDTNEFMLILIDKLITEFPHEKEGFFPKLNIPNPLKSPLQRLADQGWKKDHGSRSNMAKEFYGQMVQQVKCPQCGSFSHRVESFMSLDISLDNDTNVNGLNISNEIKKLFNAEYVDGYSCDKCKSTADKAEKLIRLWHIPQMLIISIKRFTYDGRKNRTKIRHMPNELNLGKYLISEEDPHNYILSSMICHMGSVYGGHYTALIHNHNTDGSWTMMDDDTRITNYNIENLNTESVYTIFYQKVSK